MKTLLTILIVFLITFNLGATEQDSTKKFIIVKEYKNLEYLSIAIGFALLSVESHDFIERSQNKYPFYHKKMRQAQFLKYTSIVGAIYFFKKSITPQKVRKYIYVDHNKVGVKVNF